MKKSVLLQVRVPTREDASCLFWEFASDFDVGFGVQFEGIAAPPQICLQVFDTDEDENEETAEGAEPDQVQVVKAVASAGSTAGLRSISL